MLFDPARRTTSRTEGVQVSITATQKMAVRAMTLEEYRRTEHERQAPAPPSRGTHLAELLGPIREQAWRDEAACKGKPTDWWFPEANHRWSPAAARARKICGTCPVAEPCHAYAVRHGMRGIWGQTYSERKRESRPVPTRELGPTSLAILQALKDGHWHDYDELFEACRPTITVEQAARRWNKRREAQGRQSVAERHMTKAALGSGRRMIFVDCINTLARSGRVERGGRSTLRLRTEVAAR